MEKPASGLRSWLLRHYHWIIFGITFLYYFTYAGLVNNLYSLYLIPVTDDLQISRALFSLSGTINCIPAFFSNLLFAFCYQRFGARKLVSVTLLLYALFYLIYSQAQSIVPFYLLAALSGLVVSFVSTAGLARLLTEWFHRHQGMILGIVMAASGLGGAFFSLVLSEMIDSFGWRISYALSGLFLLLVAVLAFVLIRNTPAHMGLKPLGEQHEMHLERKKYARNHEDWDGIPLSTLYKRPYFYLMLLAIFFIGLSAYIIFPTLVSHVQDLGMGQNVAARIQGSMFLFLAAAKILEGILSDRFGAKRVMVFCVICCIVSAVLLADVSSPWLAIFGVAIFSLALAVPTIMLPVITSSVFGRHDYSTILGIILAVMQLCNGFGGAIGNFCYDIMGSYTVIYLITAGLSLLSLVMFLLVFHSAEKERTKMEAAKQSVTLEESK